MFNRWLVEDPDSDVYGEFDTEAEAVACALECIDEYRKNAHGEWPDSVDHIRILQVAYVTREVEVEGGIEFNLSNEENTHA